MKTIAVMTSGGDSPGMNAAIRSVVRTCAFYEVKCVGIYRGYEGLMESDFIDLDARSVKGIINKGGTILKSARSKTFRTKAGRELAYKAFKAHNIDGLVVIGGDGSFTGAMVFNKDLMRWEAAEGTKPGEEDFMDGFGSSSDDDGFGTGSESD